MKFIFSCCFFDSCRYFCYYRCRCRSEKVNSWIVWNYYARCCFIFSSYHICILWLWLWLSVCLVFVIFFVHSFLKLFLLQFLPFIPIWLDFFYWIFFSLSHIQTISIHFTPNLVTKYVNKFKYVSLLCQKNNNNNNKK